MGANKQIGWSQESILLHGVSKQLERLAGLVAASGGGGGGGGTWGTITGTLSDQTDLQNALNLKAPIASPVFTGSATAPAFIVPGGIPYQYLMADGSVMTKNWMYQTFATITNATALQKMFPTATPNGAFNVVAGKRYFFNVLYILTNLTGTGTISFGWLGTSTTSTVNMLAHASKGAITATTSQLTFPGTFGVNTNIPITTSLAGASGKAIVCGNLNCTVSGTLIPAFASSIAQAAGNVEAFFEIWELGDTTENFRGNFT